MHTCMQLIILQVVDQFSCASTQMHQMFHGSAFVSAPASADPRDDSRLPSLPVSSIGLAGVARSYMAVVHVHDGMAQSSANQSAGMCVKMNMKASACANSHQHLEA